MSMVLWAFSSQLVPFKVQFECSINILWDNLRECNFWILLWMMISTDYRSHSQLAKTGRGLLWSSILVDWRCWIRLKKSSLGIVLFLETSVLGSGDLWSLIRELWHSKIISNSSSLDRPSASPSSHLSWSSPLWCGKPLAGEGISQRWSSILAPCSRQSVSNKSSSSPCVRWWVSSGVLAAESGNVLLWSSNRRLWLFEIMSRNPSSTGRCSSSPERRLE